MHHCVLAIYLQYGKLDCSKYGDDFDFSSFLVTRKRIAAWRKDRCDGLMPVIADTSLMLASHWIFHSNLRSTSDDVMVVNRSTPMVASEPTEQSRSPPASRLLDDNPQSTIQTINIMIDKLHHTEDVLASGSQCRILR